MGDKKYQIFISSTYKDLVEAREKVTKQILSMYHFPIGMEMFSAGDDDQWTVIKNTIDKSDYYIIIIGHRYGSLTAEGISYTEKEYDYAKENGIPIIAFIRHRDVPISEDNREKVKQNEKKLEKFIDKASKNKMCSYWGTEDELAALVSTALYKEFYSRDRVGWVRANSINNNEENKELISLKMENQRLREELNTITLADSSKHYAVQPWFYISHIVREGADAPNKLFLVNDSSNLIRIESVKLYLDDINFIELEYKYLTKSGEIHHNGKYIGVEIQQNPNLIDKEGIIKIIFKNQYNRTMTAISPKVRFYTKVSSLTNYIDVSAVDLVNVPFTNVLEANEEIKI